MLIILIEWVEPIRRMLSPMFLQKSVKCLSVAFAPIVMTVCSPIVMNNHYRAGAQKFFCQGLDKKKKIGYN